ncbi:TetR/AcrR family transcriptional regulator [Acinetobacter sp. ANC 3882]|uniref:TetR/AcrR family transcriptional regulator n=1 Tax=Acinetobacter sp. ANC 3882 TaxID=2923423 RepID=UPI001F4A20BA|nr:TetR/AcrR family transcriptional regulator [Acinetobacter sp. ANC 3882]MCH7313081.1 TetR/AcrR family transcriptional regulator [Acinetobacter sp. ANC 3882]
MNEIRLPIQKRSLERLELVLLTTINLLENNHIEECSIQEISEISGVPRNFIYQYFPTVNHLFSLIVNNYYVELNHYLKEKSEFYENLTAMLIFEDMIKNSSSFFNQNKAASALILGGPINIDGSNLHQTINESIAKDLFHVLNNKKNPILIKDENHIVYLVQLAVSLMRHSYFKYKEVTAELQDEALFVCKIYMENKGYTLN